MSRVELFKKQLETLIARMDYFCLDPKLSNFIEICENTKLKNEQADVFETWRLAALNKYGDAWEISDNENNKKLFSKEYDKLSAVLLMKPTKIALNKIWYVFYATGEYDSLLKAYQVSGSYKTNKELCELAADIFNKVRTNYIEKINNTIKEKPRFFIDHEVRINNETPYAYYASLVFNKIDSVIKQNIEKINEFDGAVNEDTIFLKSALSVKLSKNVDFKIKETAQSKELQEEQKTEEPEEPEESESDSDSENEKLDPKNEQDKQKIIQKNKKYIKKQVKKASKAFDDIAKDVLANVGISKK